MSYDSMVLSFIQALVQRFSKLYYSSCIAAIFRKIGEAGKRLFSSSTIWNFVKRKDLLTKWWEYSFAYKILYGFSGLLVKSCRLFYKRFENVFYESVFFRLLKRIIFKFEIIIAAVLLLFINMPHRLWHNEYSTFLVLLLAFLYFIKTIIQKHERINLKAIDFMLFIFMVTVILAELTSILPKDSAKFFLFYGVSFLLVFIIVSAVNSRRALELLVEIVMVGITVSAVYGAFQALRGVPADVALTDMALNEGMPGRIFSTMGNPNNYAELLILAIPFYAAVFLNTESILKKLVYLALALPPVVALFLTGSRSSWVAFSTAALVFVFFKNRKLLPVLVIIGLMCIPLLPQWVYRRILTIFNPADKSGDYRRLIYNAFWPILKDYWATGIGLGPEPFTRLFQRSFEYVYRGESQTLKDLQIWSMMSFVDSSIPLPATPPHSHNLFLQVWIETGIIGIVSFVWFIVRMVKKCMQNISRKADEKINHILMAGVAAIAGISVMGMAEYIWFYPRIMLFFWVVIGIILAGLSILAKKSEGPSNAVK